MKIRFTLLALLALLSFSVIACEEDPASPDDPTMKAEVDGDEKETNDVVVTELASSRIITGAFAADGSSIRITLTDVDAPISIDLPDANGSSIIYTMGTTTYMGMSGEIDVTTYDAAGVAGSFSFTGMDLMTGDTIEITDGTFSGAVN